MNMNLTNLERPCSNTGHYHQFSSTTGFRFSPSITVIIYIAYFLPFCFGVFGNISVCLIFFQQKKLRSITNTFLMNLCLNDLIVLCFSIPMTLSAALLEYWVFGAFLCKLVNFLPTLTALVSTFTVAIIAVERWFFIVNKQKFDRRCTIITLILLWLVSILIALPEFISRQIQEFVPPNRYQYMIDHFASLRFNINNETNISNYFDTIQPPCKIKKIFYCVLTPGLRMRIFSYIVITVQYLVPFLFVSVSCYSISRYLKRRMKRMRTYQIHHRRPKPSFQKIRKKSSNITDESTEQELTSYDDLPSPILTHDKPNYFLSRFRLTFQNSDRNSLHLTDQQQYLKSQSHTKRRFHRSRKLLICVAILFTISWLPLTIVQIYLEHNEQLLYSRDGANFIYGYLLIPCYLISSLSAWINPIIYNYINRSFRREFYSLYSCCLRVSSSSISRKELTSIPSKRTHRETTCIDDIQITTSPRSTLKQSTPVVCFADETTVMIHKET